MQNRTEKQMPAPGEIHAMLYGFRTNVNCYSECKSTEEDTCKLAFGIAGLSAKGGNYPAQLP